MGLKHTVHMFISAETDKLDGKGVSYTIAAEVALLSRNVKVIGEDYAQMKKESFGARVIVATKTGENDVAMTGEYNYHTLVNH